MENQIEEYFEKKNPLNFNENEKIIEIRKLANGESNVNYILITNLTKYILRFDIINKSKKLFEQEFQILKLIEKLNIGPKALFIDTSKKFFKENFMIQSFVEGEVLENLKNKKYRKHYDILAQEIANLHKLKIKFYNEEYKFEKWIKNTNKEIENLKKNLNGIIELNDLFKIYENQFKKLYSKYSYKEAFCHLDLGLLNILFDDNKFNIVDWESASLNDPALELSILFYEQQFSKTEKEIFLKKYMKIKNDKTLVKRMIFTDFFVAFSGFFQIMNTCINITNGKGHKDYLESVNLQEYWDWNLYYFNLVCNLDLFSKEFEVDLLKRLETLK